MKVGIRLGSLGTGSLKKDLQRALAIGVHGVQLRVVDTEIDPRTLSRSGREELADYIDSFEFDVAALSGELGGFGDSSAVDERVSRTRDMLDMCVELRAPLLTADAGAIPDAGSRPYDVLTDTVRALAQHAIERDVRLALTTGTEDVSRLAAFVAHVKSEGLRITYDPAGLRRVGNDPVSQVDTIGRLIAHVYARDAQRGATAEPGAECGLTKGDAQIEEALLRLREAEYDGYLTVAYDRDEDLAAYAVEAVTWLKRQEGVDP
ncbi:MAG: sugar phosphate isomerase/epimerase [Candidatus Hydrogenedentes bacterium]|nr:sugar phosphate isomerase/epimerase [Candidatus Hydrogenedentota bacterium]